MCIKVNKAMSDYMEIYKIMKYIIPNLYLLLLLSPSLFVKHKFNAALTR